MVVLARLVTPEAFGLVGMVTAFTGFLALFRDVGLSMATVQSATITHAQTSTLFWVNVAAGGVLTLLSLALAPFLTAFYHEPRLFWITVSFGVGFLFYGLQAQHRALLQRHLRFGRLVLVETSALVVSIIAAVLMALAGWSYWAVVVMSVGVPVVSAVGMWLAERWVPGLPQRGSGVRSMLHYGGVITLNSFVVYLVYNTEKILLGRLWGAKELGIYGRGYQLINLPTENLNSVMGGVMFPALSRVQQDPARLRNYFLKGYGFFLSLVMPVTIACGLFAEDIVQVLLGPQWTRVIPVFRLLAPTILDFALINPMACLMTASGRAVRSLNISFLIAPIVITGYLIGLSSGAEGVALGFSAAMIILVIPVILWAKHGTTITGRDILQTMLAPFLASVVGAAAAWSLSRYMINLEPAIVRLSLVTFCLFGVYGLVLLFGLGKWPVYLDLLKTSGLWKGSNKGVAGT